MSASRTPSEMRPPRMKRLARLPLFFALEGKRTVVAGGSAAAAWKAELLSAAGAAVDVFAVDAGDEMKSAAAEAPGGQIVLYARDWTEGDFAGAVVAIGAFEDEHEAARFASTARVNSVPVNVVDKPVYCDFAFGSIVNRSPLVIGISTDGAAPVFGQAIRARIEAMIPQGFVRWAEAAKRWRSEVQASGLSFAGRRRFWQLFTARAATEPDREPDGGDYRDLVERTREEGRRVDKGSVTLVGAGPGDPELLTLRAVRALQSADVILIDDLVSPQVLDFARREAKKMLVGKTGRGPSCKQGEINELMLSLARAGKRVVRLKGGDPLIFGRAGEEVAACEQAGIPVEVVPGISAAQGAAARLGVSLTHRDHARRVQFVTGHAKDGRLPGDIDWPSIADPAATTAVYMPGKTLAEFVERAAAEGLTRDTPAIVVSNATRSNERVIGTTIEKLPERLAAEPVAGPLLLLIGAVFAEKTGGAAGSAKVTARSA
jgi:uroporphyrin-III C-methyltransferase / precorrin-2 dehydrogenase / sirohydrochlorin ferrochelatase